MSTSNTVTMESLALPAELIWDGKLEPMSSPASELFPINDLSENWLYDCDLAATGLPSLLLDDDENMGSTNIIGVHGLGNGDDVVVELYDLKDEYLLDSKLLDYAIGIDVAQPQTITKVPTPINTTAIFNQSSFDNAVLAQLTPPQSPPRNSAASSPVYQEPSQFIESPNNFSGAISGTTSPGPQSPASPSDINTTTIVISPTTFLNSATPVIVSNAVPTNFTFNWTAAQEAVDAAPSSQTNNITTHQNQSDDFERDLQLLDEIVNTRAKELPEWNALDESESQSSFSTPSQAGSMTSDDDWHPESCYSSSVSSPVYQHSGDEQFAYSPDPSQPTDKAGSSTTTKKRTRQYGRGVEDRKIRKKEQNKNAATRYRLKKKLEMESVLIEEQKLLERNAELQRILSDVKREAKYLKSLLREFYQKEKQKS